MEHSSGAVLFKENKYLLLLYGYGHWGFVKGKIENGETIEETFIRETFEETGIDKDHLTIFPDFLEKISYFYKKEGKTIFKEVEYLLAESTTFTVHLSSEHEGYQWLSYSEALKQITYDNDRNVLRKAYTFLQKKL